MRDGDQFIIPVGNRGTKEKPFVMAYMCAVAYEYEVTATSTRLFPSVEAHRAGCPCGKWGSVEVTVHFERYIKSDEAIQKEAERERKKEEERIALEEERIALEEERIALQAVVEQIHALKNLLPVPLNVVSEPYSLEMVDYWLERHKQLPNGHALFWALNALRQLGDVNECSVEFWEAMLAAGKELQHSWSVEARSALA